MMRRFLFRLMSDQNNSREGAFMLVLKIIGQALLMMLVLGVISGCKPDVIPPSQPTLTPPILRTSANKTIVVGSKGFTEQRLLSQMLILILQQAGYEVVDKTQAYEMREARDALVNGEIDIYWEYTGTALLEYYDQKLPKDSVEAFNKVKELDKLALIWLKPANFNNTYTLLVQPPLIEELGGGTLEDLAQYMKENDAPLTLCVEKDFIEREQDGLKALQGYYDFEFKEDKRIEEEIANYLNNYERLRNGECDVAEGFSTDAQISAWGLHSLSDTRTFFPPYNPAPVIRQEVLQKHPELEQLLGQIGDKLDQVTMSKLNERVDIGPDGQLKSGDEETVEDVARDFLLQADLLECPSCQIVVGSKDFFTEQELLGQMLLLILEDAGYKVVDRTNLGSTDVVRQQLEQGKIDIYWEYIGTALLQIHKQSTWDSNPEAAFEQAKELDQPNRLIWLERANFNDTYVLMVLPDLVQQGITTLEELANYMNENGEPLTLCIENEFYDRPDGLLPMQEHYGFAFKDENIKLLEYDELYEGVRDGTCDVAEGFSTDARIDSWGFHKLTDSKNFFPPYNPAPVIRQEVLAEHPKLEQLLAQIVPHLEQNTMIELNKRVDIGKDRERHTGDEESAKGVAKMFLCDVGLLSDCPIPPPPETAACADIDMNGGFERDSHWQLPDTVWAASYTTERDHQGERALRLGITNPSDDRLSHSAAHQLLRIPADVTSATLSYWYYTQSPNQDVNDRQGALIYDSDLSSFERKLLGENGSDEKAWVMQQHDLSDFIGQEIQLYFYVDNDGDRQPSAMYIDDVTLVCE